MVDVWKGILPKDPADAETLRGAAQILYDRLADHYSPSQARLMLQALSNYPREFMAVAELSPLPATPAHGRDGSESNLRPQRRVLRPNYGTGPAGRGASSG